MKGIKHIFFDLDDTLWDFEKNSKIVLQQLFTEHQLNDKLNTQFENFHSAYKSVTDELWFKYERGEINKDAFRKVRFEQTFKTFGYSNVDENSELTLKYTERTPRQTHLKAHCLEIVEFLKGKYQLHIITNGFKEIQDIKIDGSGLRPYFDQIVISEELGISKPDTKIFHSAQRLAGCTREECVMIGDSFENDIKGGLGAGWQVIWFSEKEQKDGIHQITELKQLKDSF